MRKKYWNLWKSTTCADKIWEKSTEICERVLLVQQKMLSILLNYN